MVYVNENVKSTERVFPIQGRAEYYRFDMNENPEGLSKKFVKNVVKEITAEFLATYPEPQGFIEKYAQFVGVSPETVFPTNGSDRAIRAILETFGSGDKEVLTVAPSFEMYWVNCKILGLKHKAVEFNADFSLDVKKVIAEINENTGIVVLLNPNSPIGYTYNDRQVESIIEKARKFNALVVIDEAYHYFYDKTFIDKAKKYDNVLVLRTFSKMFSLASVRLGVIIGDKTLIDMLNKARLTFDVNSVALLFGERILERPDVIKRLISVQKKGKRFLIKQLKSLGYECYDCKGNYVLLKPKNPAAAVAKKLKDEKKILVHGYSGRLLGDYLRVTTGSVRMMRVFLDGFIDADKA